MNGHPRPDGTTPPTSNDDLPARVSRLESTNRRLWGAVAVLVSLGTISAMQSAPDRLRVQGLELVDDDGRIRAALVLEDDGPGLHLHDMEGVRRASLVQTADEVALYLRDPNGDTRLGAAHFAHGGSGYALHGPGGEGALVLYLKETGSLTSYAEDGSVVARFPSP